MKKIVVLVTLLVLAAVAAAAVFVLPPWLAGRAWGRAAERLTERLGRSVRAGDVDFSLFSPLVLRDVTVAGADGDAPLLAIERVEVDLDPWSILGDAPDVRRVLVDRPVLTIPLAPGGAPALGDLPSRLRALVPAADDDEGGGGRAGGGGGGLLARVMRATPEFQVTRGEARLVGAGVGAWSALSPSRTLPAEGLQVDHVEIVVRNTSMLAEAPIYELTGNADVAALGHSLVFTAQLALNDRTLTATLDGGGRPFAWSLGTRTLSIDGLAYGSQTGIRVRGVTLSQPAGDADPANVHPFLRIKEVAIGLDAPTEAKSEAKSEDGAIGAAAGSGAFGTLAARIGSVEFVEPEIYFSRDPEARTPIDDLEEKLYVDELDARIDEELGGDLEIDDEVVPEEKPEPSPQPGQRRRQKPNGEKIRTWIASQFQDLEASFAAFTDFVHRAGSRLPVREVHVRRGRFLYEAAASGDGSVSRKLYNFFLDAERRLPEPVFVFKMHFETPDALRSKNRVEGKIHLLTRDLQVQFRIEQLQLERYRPLLPSSLRVSPESVLHDTDLSLVYSSELNELRAHGRIFMRNFEVFHPGLAPGPLEDMDAGADFALNVDFGEHRLDLSPSTIYLNDATFTIRGRIEDYAVAPRVHFEFSLPKTDAMRIVRSIPVGLVPQLAGVQMVGSFGLEAKVDLDTADLNTLSYDLAPEPVGLAVTSMGHFVDLQKLSGSFRHTVRERDGAVSTFRVGPGAPNWTPLGQVTRYLPLALTTTEDGRFFQHDGFSPTQIRRSIIANLEKGYFYRGASTISQQLVKNLYLTRDKTLSRKLQEVFITWQMEQTVPKERILELYLNVIEWGPNLYGIKNAAQHYFGKKPAELSLLDTAFLVSIIPNPRRFYSQFERGEVTPRWRARIGRIVEAMAERGKVSEGEARRAAPYSPYFVGRRPARPDDGGDDPPPPRPDRGASAPGGAREGDIPLPPGH